MSNHAEHRKHEKGIMSTNHIRNVSYLTTHDLVKCACGFYGWLPKEEV